MASHGLWAEPWQVSSSYLPVTHVASNESTYLDLCVQIMDDANMLPRFHPRPCGLRWLGSKSAAKFPSAPRRRRSTRLIRQSQKD